MKLPRAIPAISGIADPKIRQILDAMRINLMGLADAVGTKTVVTVTSKPAADSDPDEYSTPESGAAQADVVAPAAFATADGAIGALTISNPPTQAEAQALRNAAEALADDCRALRATVAAYQILLSEIRRALIAQEIITGAA